jgi:hypothetical protein
MCAVSAVHDYYGNRPNLWPTPGLAGVAGPQWTPQTLIDFKDIIKRLEALDAKLGEPDCVDPAKEAWVAEVEKRLKALEVK